MGTDPNFLVTLLCAIVLPLIVMFNVRDRHAPSSPLSAYMWREQPLLWTLGLVFLSVLALFSMIDLAVKAGWISGGAGKAVVPWLGLPLLALSIAVVVLALRAVRQAVRKDRQADTR